MSQEKKPPSVKPHPRGDIDPSDALRPFDRPLKSFGVLSHVSQEDRFAERVPRNMPDRSVGEDLPHVSVAEVGGYANKPKSEPTGQHRMGPAEAAKEQEVIDKAKKK
jgi:hypothetical protein